MAENAGAIFARYARGPCSISSEKVNEGGELIRRSAALCNDGGEKEYIRLYTGRNFTFTMMRYNMYECIV